MTRPARRGTLSRPASATLSSIALAFLASGCTQADPGASAGSSTPQATATTSVTGPTSPGSTTGTAAPSGPARNVASPALATIPVGSCLTWYGTPGAAPVRARCADPEANWRVVRITATTYNRAGEQCFTREEGARTRYACVRRLFKADQCQEISGSHLFPFATIPCDWAGQLNAGTHIGRITRTVDGSRITCPEGQTPFDFASGEWRRVGKSVCVQAIGAGTTPTSMAAG